MTSMAKIKTGVALLGVALSLVACGGGSGGDDEKAAGPVADPAMYAETISYCQTAEPTGEAAAMDGWETRYRTGMDYNGVSIVSAAGSNGSWDEPINMAVDFRDFRGVTGEAVQSGFARPEWKMGVRIPTDMRAGSAACLTQVARIHYPVDPFAGLNIPGVTEDMLPPVDLTPELVWQSYWNREVPVAQAGGNVVDGFEFVANFAPEDGQVYFVVGKDRFPSPQSLSICYLPAASTVWDCAAATTVDSGDNWYLARRGVKQGVYILSAMQ